MSQQVSRETFELALQELGHDPAEYRGKKLSLDGFCKLYELEQDSIIEAIQREIITAHYDYHHDTIWIDALDAAHFYYCLQSSTNLFAHR